MPIGTITRPRRKSKRQGDLVEPIHKQSKDRAQGTLAWMIQKWDSWPSKFGPPTQAPSLLPVHQHEVILQQRALGVGPHHTHQAAGMQLLILVEGMRQLVHSLMGGGEGRSGLRPSWLLLPQGRLPVLPGMAQWPETAGHFASPFPSLHTLKSRAGVARRTNYSSLLSQASSSDSALKLAVLCSKSL